ncbi:phosphotransferase [Planomonospora sp. ID82291]|uniref:phosphotransferase n=1 Tax=Planomonospora sp. ID82291 TaxID=2738136 RepID=UPI0018C3EA72|nr:phosphotransferase [Planomonospora sp. ID82291]MBG0818660.1 phosphotransferase [Planomonospora sp. ID82291]
MRARPPADLLAHLRAAHTPAGPDLRLLAEAGLHPLSGGRNNLVYAWHDPRAGTEICVKLYKIDERRRFDRESHALAVVAASGVDDVPVLLWQDPAKPYPVIGMTLLPGRPVVDIGPPAAQETALKALAALHARLHEIPLTGLLARLPRIDSTSHYLHRITTLWPRQLVDAADDRLTAEMLALLRRWDDSGDRQVLLAPVPPVFSRGDANLLNWLWDGRRIRCVDFEFAGHSDVAFDAADLTEHISARDVPDEVWENLAAGLGITDALMPRFRAAQRTCALRWLAVLWRQRATRVQEFTAQRERLLRLLATARL